MNKKNLYKEEDYDDDDQEEDEEDEENGEEVDDSIVDFRDLLNISQGNNFHTTGNFNILNVNAPTTFNELKEKNRIMSNSNQNFYSSGNELNNNQLNANVKDESASNNDKLESQIMNKIDILDLDLQSMPKEDIINLLLNNEATNVKKQKKYKFNPRASKSGMNGIYTNMQQMNDNKDPELAQDFNLALTKVLSKMMKDPKNSNQEVFDILLSDREKIEEELEKYEFTKKVNIQDKVKLWIEKKNKSLEIIQEKLNEDFQKQHTFTPNLNNNKSSMIRRNLDQFLEDQQNHCKKIKEKLEILRENRLQEYNNNVSNAPKINQTSKKLAENKLKCEQQNLGSKVYERLYNKRNPNQNINAASSSSGGAGFSTGADGVNNSRGGQGSNPAKSPPKILNKKAIERTQNLYQDALNRQNKQKENQKKIQLAEKPQSKKSNFNSNKFILKKFKLQFSEEVERLFAFSEINSSSQEINNKLNKLNFNQLVNLMQNLNFISNEIYENESEQEGTSNNPLCTKNQEKKLILELYENIRDTEGFVNLDHLFIFCLSILNVLEYFVIKSYKSQYNTGNNPYANYANTINAKEDNEDYNNKVPSQIMNNNLSQKNLKSSNSNIKIIKKANSIQNLNDDAIENLIQKLNFELSSRIIINKKYGGFDEDSNYIITFTNAKLILKDYNLFAFNYSNHNHRNKQNNKVQLEAENNFNPKINPKSVQLSNKFRQKMINEIEAVKLNENSEAILYEINRDRDRENFSPTNRNLINHHQRRIMSPNHKNAFSMDYVELMNLKKKKIEKYTQEIRREKEIKEMEKCTFKPKINNYNYRDNVVPMDGVSNQRIELLYKKGMENLMNKKTKTKDEMEFEKHGRECSFKPNINERDFQEVFDENKNQIFYDRDVIKFNERMKRGREDKEHKEKMFRRGEDVRSPPKVDEKRNKSESKLVSMSNQNLINYLPNNKNKFLKNDLPNELNSASASVNAPTTSNATANKNNDLLIPQDQIIKNANFKNNISTGNDAINTITNTVNNTINNNFNNCSNNKIDKHSLPLLIIDVNIRPGEKHKITVYDGDTSDQLAEKFAIEHKLDYHTKNKLKNLIESQLIKLLPKIIEEETQSIRSDKSNGYANI